MAKQKFYVVWKGKKPGIYTSWEECKKQIENFKQGFPFLDIVKAATISDGIINPDQAKIRDHTLWVEGI